MSFKIFGKVKIFNLLYFTDDKNLRDVFEIGTRKKIYEHILKFPGLHLREIQRNLQIPLSVCEYHLNYLAEKQIIVIKVDKYFRRYYPTNFGVKEKDIMSCLRQENPRKIVLFLLLNANANHKDVVSNLKLPQSSISFYINDLANKGIIRRIKEGRETKYEILNKDDVVKMLIAYKQSFLDKLVDRFLEIWFEKLE